MPVVTLTDLFIQRLPACDPHTTYYDKTMPNFGIRVGKRSRTFVFMHGLQRRRISLGRYPFTTLKAARSKASALLSGTIVPSQNGGPKAAAVLEQYFDAHEKTTRPSTHKEARRLLVRHFLAHFGGRPINDITTGDLTRVIDALLKTPAEAIKAHAAISGFMNWSLRRQIVTRNPLAGMPLPAKPKSRDRVLTDPELAAILRAAQRTIDQTFSKIVYILAFTGLRKNEAATLTWPNITPETIRIPPNITKNNVELILPNTINDFFDSFKPLHLALFKPPPEPELFIPIIIHWPSDKREFNKLCGVTEWVLHDLRRTLSTKMAEWEIAPPDVVEAILNHVTGSRSQIQRVYDRSKRMAPMRRALEAYRNRLRALMAS